ncbi:protein kinase [Streptomyces sp. NPDC057555]|uniref:protein kinase domain-containing protein n=1 Tax=Streptomyces sp. NPDC057555 TaxID=3346166 RepID=UPI00367E3B9D
MGAAPPAEAVAALEPLLGPVTCHLLSDRRGSRAWKAIGSRGTVALKANNPEAGPGRDKAAEMAQEDRHLLALTDASALSPGYRVDAGAWDGGRWLAVRWIDGTPLWNAMALARGPEGDGPSVRPWLLGIARTWAEQLERLHAVGWTHADVQPTNTLITPDSRAAIFDFALSCGPGPDTTGRLPYRGALTHTTAPEIADALLNTPADTHVQVRPPADIWGLGASLFWCWTGHRPVPYADDTPRRDKLRAIADGKRLQLDDTRPWFFPVFEEVVTACMAPTPEERLTAADLVAIIEETQ